MKIVILFFVFLSVTNGKLWNPTFYPISSYSGYSYSSPYEALRNYHRALYYARKAHDLAKLKSGIHGIGHGLYGYRYGGFSSKWSKSHSIPSYGSPILPYAGLGHHKTFHHSGFPLRKFSYGKFNSPKSYGSSYAHNYGYGKEYSYSNKNSNVNVNSAWSAFPNKFFPSHTPVGKAPHTILYSGIDSFSPGHQYSYFVKDSHQPKYFRPAKGFSGYDSLYGSRYNIPSPVPDTQEHGWKDAPVGTVIGEPPVIKIPFTDGAFYGSNYDGFPHKTMVGDSKYDFGYDSNPNLDSYPKHGSFGNEASFSLYPSGAKELSVPQLPYDFFENSGDFLSGFDGKNVHKVGDPRNVVPDLVPEIVPGSSDLTAHGSSKSQVVEEKKKTVPDTENIEKD